jgi:hypothetical protein
MDTAYGVGWRRAGSCDESTRLTFLVSVGGRGASCVSKIGLRKFKPYRCHAEAIIGLGLADETELKAIKEEGIVAEQLRDIEQLEKDAAQQ